MIESLMCLNRLIKPFLLTIHLRMKSIAQGVFGSKIVFKVHRKFSYNTDISIRYYILWEPVVFPNHFMIPSSACQGMVFQNCDFKCHIGKHVDFSTLRILVLHSEWLVVLSVEMYVHCWLGYSSLSDYPHIVYYTAFIHPLLLLLLQV